MAITEGKAFEVDGFNYAAGWSIGKDALGDLDVKGLKVTNNRDDTDSALVEIKVWKGTEVLALTDCTTEPIGVGTTVTLSCFSARQDAQGLRQDHDQRHVLIQHTCEAAAPTGESPPPTCEEGESTQSWS